MSKKKLEFLINDKNKEELSNILKEKEIDFNNNKENEFNTEGNEIVEYSNSENIELQKNNISNNINISNNENNINYTSNLIENNSEEEYNHSPLDIQVNLIKKQGKLGNKNRIENYSYNKVDTNCIISIDPKIVIFKGFECQEDNILPNIITDKNSNSFDINNNNDSIVKSKNKNYTYKKKALVINVSKFSQRVSILPPTTPFFKIQFSRRGLIPSGLSEKIIIYFTPLKYEYYYDYIRVYCEGEEKLVIPIHAFPVMDINKTPNYVPKFIDFNNVVVFSNEKRTIKLFNKISKAAFQFEFYSNDKVKTPEIKIEPLYGEVKPNNEVSIDIIFNPNKLGIYTANYIFRLSEFDFNPTTIVITGSCNRLNNYDNLLNNGTAVVNSYENNVTIERENNKKRNLDLINKINYPKKNCLNNINNDNFKENKLLTENSINSSNYKRLNVYKAKDEGFESNKVYLHNNNIDIPNTNFDSINTETSQRNKTIESKKSLKNKNYSSVKPLSSRRMINSLAVNEYTLRKEKEFLDYFNKIDKLIKDKEIKYIKFIGKRLWDSKEELLVKYERYKEKNFRILSNRDADLQRYKIAEYNKRKPIINEKFFNLDNYLVQPCFSENNNNQFFKAKVYFDLFLKAMTKIIINNRADKNLRKIKDMITNNNIKNSLDFERYMIEDWNKYYNKEDYTDEYVKIKCNVNPLYISKEPIMISEEFSLDCLKQNISHENYITFEDYHTYKEFDKIDNEIINYKEFKTNGLSMYEQNLNEKEYRKGSCLERTLFK